MKTRPIVLETVHMPTQHTPCVLSILIRPGDTTTVCIEAYHYLPSASSGRINVARNASFCFKKLNNIKYSAT